MKEKEKAKQNTNIEKWKNFKWAGPLGRRGCGARAEMGSKCRARHEFALVVLRPAWRTPETQPQPDGLDTDLALALGSLLPIPIPRQ